MNDDKSLNQSILKAFKLLDAFTSEKKEWGVRELAHKIGYNKSTTYRLLNTLAHLNIVHQNNNEKYSLGSKLFELGNRTSIYKSIKNLTNNPIKSVALEIQETVLLSTLKEGKVFYLNKADSLHGLKINTTVGSQKPIHATASGKLLLAFSSKEYQQQFFNKNTLQPLTEKTITKPSKLNSELQKIQAQQYALDIEEFELGLVSIAIPIYNKDNRLIASLSASGPLSRFRMENVESYRLILQKGANQIQKELENFEGL